MYFNWKSKSAIIMFFVRILIINVAHKFLKLQIENIIELKTNV